MKPDPQSPDKNRHGRFIGARRRASHFQIDMISA